MCHGDQNGSFQYQRSAQAIAILNDAFRTTFLSGSICVTVGVRVLGDDFVKDALAAVRAFSDFDDANDPYAEHDCGAFTIAGRRLFWKIDYFDPCMCQGSENPADQAMTRRVLTIMLAEEY